MQHRPYSFSLVKHGFFQGGNVHQIEFEGDPILTYSGMSGAGVASLVGALNGAYNYGHLRGQAEVALAKSEPLPDESTLAV